MFPERRMRRNRMRSVRHLTKETRLCKEQLIMPIFVDETAEEKIPIASMPGQYRYPLSEVAPFAESLLEKGIKTVILFGIPAEKDEEANSAYAEDGIIQKAVQKIREAVPGMTVITDVCACEYTTHGHCGIIGEIGHGPDLLNDPSLELMGRIAVSHAKAGADIVAPSCMLDGMVGAIRAALDDAGFTEILIMSYSSKFCSSYYGPFRDAADSGYGFGDRSTYQISPGNAREAVLESELDAGEGADILMVKPAGLYLDIIAQVKEIGLPVAAYQVSGEYSQICAAAERGWLDRRGAAMESLTSIKRAGADMIITYFAEEAAKWTDEE